jgi:hypothetical protein
LNGARVSLVRLNERGQIIVLVAVPVQRFRAVLGALVLSTTGGEIDQRAISQMASQIVNNSMFGGQPAPRGPPLRRRSVKPNKKSR